MRLLGLRILAVFVGFSVLFPFSAAALIAVGNLDIPGMTESVVVVDGVAYAAVSGLGTGASGLRVIDVSNPTAPVEFDPLGIPPIAFTVVDGLAYLVKNDFSGMAIIDVSNPAAPIALSELEIDDAYNIAVECGLAYVASIFGSRTSEAFRLAS